MVGEGCVKNGVGCAVADHLDANLLIMLHACMHAGWKLVKPIEAPEKSEASFNV